MLRFSFFVLVSLISLPAQSQEWRRVLETVPAQNPADTKLRDIEMLRVALHDATPSLLSANPSDYEANRDLVRRVMMYLASMELVARDPAMRMAVGRAYRDVGELTGSPRGQSVWDRNAAVSAYGRSAWLLGGISRRGRNGRQLDADLEAIGTRMAILGATVSYANEVPPAPAAPAPPPAPDPTPAPAASGSPFPSMARVPAGLSSSDKQQFEQLQERYANAANNAATAWENIEGLRRTLAGQGMALNSELSSGVARMQLYLELAAANLEAREWANARQNIERAEYQTTKVLKFVGR